MPNASASDPENAGRRIEEAVAPLRRRYGGLRTCLVTRAPRTPIVEATYDSLRAGFVRMGLAVDEVAFADPSDLVGPDALRRLRAADVVVKVLHGADNRSGLVQAFLRALGLRVAGHRAHTDVLSQRKSLVKELMATHGVPTLPFAVVRRGEPAAPGFDAGLDGWGEGYVLKPDDANASEGLAYVPDAAALRAAVEEGFGPHLVEPYVRGRVLTVGVLTVEGQPYPVPPIEYVLRDDQLLMDESWKRDPVRLLPDGLDPGTARAVMAYAVTLHEAVEARGVSRSDFVVGDGRVHALEINTNIGLSERHDIGVAFRENGLAYEDLLWAHVASAFAPEGQPSEAPARPA